MYSADALDAAIAVRSEDLDGTCRQDSGRLA